MENQEDEIKEDAFKTFPELEFSSFPNDSSFDLTFQRTNKPSQSFHHNKLKKLKKFNKLIKSIRSKKSSNNSKKRPKKSKITKLDLFTELTAVSEEDNNNDSKYLDFGFIDTNGLKTIKIKNYDSDSQNAKNEPENDKTDPKNQFSQQKISEKEEWRAFESSRYFAPKYCVVERDNELKRFRPLFYGKNNSKFILNSNV